MRSRDEPVELNMESFPGGPNRMFFFPCPLSISYNLMGKNICNADLESLIALCSVAGKKKFISVKNNGMCQG